MILSFFSCGAEAIIDKNTCKLSNPSRGTAWCRMVSHGRMVAWCRMVWRLGGEGEARKAKGIPKAANGEEGAAGPAAGRGLKG